MGLKIKNYIILLLVLNFAHKTISQNKYITREGQITFESEIETSEPIKATQNSVTAVLNADTGEIAVLALVKGFRFKNALMEEHFNENYAESDLFPKTTFKGKIKDFKMDSGNSNHFISGTINFHGVNKNFDNIPVVVNIKDSEVILKGTFITPVKDFDIKIPKIVSKKIASDINISFELKLQKK